MLSSGINKEKLCLLMAISRISRSFKDISLSFEPHPVTQDLKILRNESAIRRSVRNIVQTIPTERHFDPLFGSDVYNSLFDFVDFGTASNIQDQIRVALDNFEPRIANVDVSVDAQPDTNAFEITIIYDIIGQEFPTQEYTFLLEATR
jgi:phage baseplate assembly protein W